MIKRYYVESGGLQQKSFSKKQDARTYAKKLSLTSPYSVIPTQLIDTYKSSSHSNLSKYTGKSTEIYQKGKLIK